MTDLERITAVLNTCDPAADCAVGNDEIAWAREHVERTEDALSEAQARLAQVEPALGELIADLACALDHWSDQDNPAYKECLANLLRIAKDVVGLNLAKHLTALGIDVDAVIKTVKERG